MVMILEDKKKKLSEVNVFFDIEAKRDRLLSLKNISRLKF